MRVILADGSSVDLGKVEITPTIGITDFSRRVTDAFGVTSIVPRNFSRRMSMRLAVPVARSDEVYAQLVNLRAKKATFIADDRYAWLQTFGIIKDFEFSFQTGDMSFYTLSIDGLAESGGVADTGIDPATPGHVSSFKLVQPVSVTDAVLTSSTVAEADAPAWSSAATYALGATVTRGHRLFESLIAGNTGADPADTPAKWLDTGPTNRWAMFDDALGTSTIASSAVEVVLKAGKAVTALALLDTNAAEIRIRAPGYDRTQVPNAAGQAVFADLVVAATASITVTVTPAVANPGPQRWDDGAQWMDAGVWRDSLAAGDGTVTIGTFLFGEMKGLGATETSVTASITDFSRKETDEFGEVTIVQRAWAKKMAAKTLIRSDAVDVVADRLAAVRAQPCLWIGRSGADSLTVFGFPRSWSIEIGQNVSKLTLEIEGLSKAAPIRPASTGSVAWPDITDPTGTKPTDNADKTSENTSKDTNAVGGVPAASVTGRLDTLLTVTIPAVEAAGAAAGQRITETRAAADLALNRIETEVERVDTRIDNLSASGGYDDTDVNARITDERQLSLGRDAALGTRIDTVTASVSTTDTNLRALITTKEMAAVGREDAISQRIDQLIAEGGGGSDGVDTVARAEISRVEQAAVLGQTALSGRATVLEASSRADTAMLNGNANFSNWPDERGTVPGGWGLAAANAGAVGGRAPGILGKWALDTSWPGSSDGSGFYYAVTSFDLNDAGGGVDLGMRTGPGWYVMEADITLVSGSLVGAGLYLGGYNRDFAGVYDQYGGFATEAANGGDPVGAGVPGTRYRFAMLRDCRNPATANFRFHPMVAWAGFAQNIPAKHIIWHKAGVRAATPQEIEARKASTGLGEAVARIKTTEDTLADLPNRYATAQRASNIEAAVGGVGGRLNSLETVTSNGTFATAARAEQIASYAGGVEAKVDLQAGTIAGLGQKTAAYVRFVADAGNGRAALSLWSDQYGGAWSLTGNGLIDGNLTVNGTITARKFDGASMAREAYVPWTGNASPNPGQTITILSLSLPSIPPTGRFIYEYTIVIASNVGTGYYGTDGQGRTVYNTFVADGGGVFVQATDPQGHVYTPRPNASDRVLSTVDFVPTFTAIVRRGTRDQLVVDADGTRTQYYAATFTVTRIDLKVTWVAV